MKSTPADSPQSDDLFCSRLDQIINMKHERIYVDRGYRGHDYPNKHCVYRSGQTWGVFRTIKKELRRRSVVEPIIGHLKSDGRLGGNYLKGTLGDQQNAVLCSAGYNFRLLPKWLRKRFWLGFYRRVLIEKLVRYGRLYFYNGSRQPALSF